MKPYIYWFEFTDSLIGETTGNSDVSFFECLLIAYSSEEALNWGNQQSLSYKESGGADTIERCWIEPVITHLITKEGAVTIDWENWAESITRQPTYLYHHGTAVNVNEGIERVNAIIRGLEGEMAGTIWKRYIAQNHPELEVESCSPLRVPVALVGQTVLW